MPREVSLWERSRSVGIRCMLPAVLSPRDAGRLENLQIQIADATFPDRGNLRCPENAAPFRGRFSDLLFFRAYETPFWIVSLADLLAELHKPAARSTRYHESFR